MSSTPPHLRHIANVGYATRKGGRISVTGSKNTVVAPVQISDYGIDFGPVKLRTSSGSQAVVSNISFGGDGGGWLSSLFGVFALGHTGVGASSHAASPKFEAADGDPTLTRREAILIAATVATAAGSGSVAGANGSDIAIASFSVADSGPGGVRIELGSGTKRVFPDSSEYSIGVDGPSVDSESGVIIPPNSAAEVKISTAGVGSFLSGIEKMTGSPSWEYQVAIPKQADQYNEGDKVPVTSDPTIIQSIEQADNGDGSSTILRLGENSIPHREEDTEYALGYYELTNGTVQYHVGPDPPPARDITIHVNVSTVSEVIDDITRTNE